MAFTSVERRIIPAYLWTPFILLLGLIYALAPSRRIGAVLCLVLGLMIPLFREVSFAPLKVMSNWVATYSYGIYLSHSFCIWLALTRFHTWTLFALTMVGLPVVVYHGIEHPAIKIGNKLAFKLSGPKRRQEFAVAA